MFDSIKTWFSNFWGSYAGKVVKKAFSAVVSQAGVVAVDLLTARAMQEVTRLESTTDPGTMKADVARKTLEAFALRQGLVVSASLINWAIENAVQALKAKE